MSIPAKLKYTRDHEWIRFDEEGVAIVGVTHHAQEELSDVVYVELPTVGDPCGAGDGVAVVESVKAASDIYAPLAGTVVEVNEALESAPGLINSDPYGQGWIFKLELADAADRSELLDADAYGELVG